MAIVRDSSTAVMTTGAVSSKTFAHTCTGSDLLLLVSLVKRTNDDITGVTYNGVAMTQIVKRNHSDSTEFLYIYGLLNPATGTNNVVVSASGSSSLYYGAVSYTGVDQGQTLTTLTATSATSTCTITIPDDSGYVMYMLAQNSVDAVGAGTNTTLVSTSNGTGGLESNPLVIAVSGAFAMSATGTSNDSIAVAFAPATGGGGGSSFIPRAVWFM